MFRLIMSDISDAIENLKKISFQDKKIRYGFYALIIFTVFLYCAIKFNDNKGSSTDWISAVSDITTAIAALWGVLIAKNWLSELTTKDGYQVAYNIKNITIPKINENIQSVTYVNAFRDVLPPLKKDKKVKKLHVVFAAINYTDFHAAFMTFFNLKRNLDKELHGLETYGWRVKEEKQQRYDEMQFLIRNHLEYSHYILEHMRRFIVLFFGSSSFDSFKENQIVDAYEVRYDSLDDDWLLEMKADITRYQMNFNMLKAALDNYQNNDLYIGKNFEKIF